MFSVVFITLFFHISVFFGVLFATSQYLFWYFYAIFMPVVAADITRDPVLKTKRVLLSEGLALFQEDSDTHKKMLNMQIRCLLALFKQTPISLQTRADTPTISFFLGTHFQHPGPPSHHYAVKECLVQTCSCWLGINVLIAQGCPEHLL